MKKPSSRRSEEEASLVRTLVDTKILTKEQGAEFEALLSAGKQGKAGKLLGKFLNMKERGRRSRG
jgi:hypothetical protein